MKKQLLSVILAAIFPLIAFAGAETRKEYTLEKNWKFTRGDVADATMPTFNDAKWQTVSIPHDWAIYGPFEKSIDSYSSKIDQNLETKETLKTGRTGSLPFVGVGWYRLKFSVPEFKTGKQVTLLFDGAMSHAQVYLNGKEVGRWPYGYSSFHFDITPFLKQGGENVLAVRLENHENQSRWYPGAGLYRNVHVIVTEETHIPVWGTYVTTPKVSSEFAKVNIKTKIETKADVASLKVETEIYNSKGEMKAKSVRGMAKYDDLLYDQDLILYNPSLWSPETPVLYTAVTKVYENDVLKDSYTSRFGIRDIKYEPKVGFSLNGVRRKIKGVCLHHDLGPLGTAINVAALRRELSIMKEMGCDAIRTSHNPPATELLDLCDEMGLMVMDESFDEWKSPKVGDGYAQFFNDWAEKDMMNMIHRDRNHPSIILWSIGNEIGEQGMVGGNKVLKYLQDICHREDPTRPVGAGMDRYDGAMNNNFAAIIDVPGFNYKPMKYAEALKKLPQGFLLGSETASTISSRGVYKFPVVQGKNIQHPDIQCSSYDVEYCYWSQIPDDEFAKQDDIDNVIGEFVWTGFDYLGEPTPYDEFWPAHSSYFGICDLAGLPKDRYFLYRSRWNTSKETLHLLPHWTWPGREGQVTPVYCYTNYPSAELFINGKSMGKQTKSHESNMKRYRLMWNDVKYEAGTLKVVAYDADGKAVATQEVHTAGKPHHIELVPDRTSLTADGKDVAFVTVKVVDEQGNLCPDADNLLNFSTAGAGTYRAAANGDATSLEQFHLPRMHTFKGMLTAIVQTSESAGKLTLKVEGKGLKAATVSFSTSK